jgi:nucleotide-binding universal stress UspA family protein
MTYKTILVHTGVDPETPNRLKVALALGARFGAAVMGVGAIAWDPYVDPTLGYVDGETIALLRNEVDEDIAAAEVAFRTACAGYLHPVIWRSLVEYPAQAMTTLSRCADLIVASRPQKGFGDRRLPSPAELVMESGLPVVLVPPGRDSLQPRTVVVGWKNTREARRAVSDALPLLKSADRVHLVQIAEADDAAAVTASLQDVVDRLARHGIEAEASTPPQLKLSPTEELMGIAQSQSADLLVLGAYGHSRAREWAFGGVTADLLDGAPVPILFSR